VERGDDEIGVVCLRAVENLLDERARRGHGGIERREGGSRLRRSRRELLGLVGEAERRDGQVVRLEHRGFERRLPVSAGAGVCDSRVGQVRGGVAQRGLAVVENVIVRERDERGTCGFEGRHREGGSRSEVVPLVRPARPAIGDALQVPDQSVEFLKPRESVDPQTFSGLSSSTHRSLTLRPSIRSPTNPIRVTSPSVVSSSLASASSSPVAEALPVALRRSSSAVGGVAAHPASPTSPATPDASRVRRVRIGR